MNENRGTYVVNLFESGRTTYYSRVYLFSRLNKVGSEVFTLDSVGSYGVWSGLVFLVGRLGLDETVGFLHIRPDYQQRSTNIQNPSKKKFVVLYSLYDRFNEVTLQESIKSGF